MSDMSAGHESDVIFLHDLRIETVVGIWEWERRIRQTISIDLEMGADIRRAAAEGQRSLHRQANGHSSSR